MQLNVNSAPVSSKPVRIGWFLLEEKSSILMYPPEPNGLGIISNQHSSSTKHCHLFTIRCPFDINISFQRDNNGKPYLVNKSGFNSPIRSNKLSKVIHLTPEPEWRYSDRPIIQLALSYCFIADEACQITQLDAFDFYRPTPLPGTIFGGRFPIHSWARPLMWAFEWHDIEQDLILKRGDPLFHVQFEIDDPMRDIELVRAKLTPELQRWILSMEGVSSMTGQTFSLFKRAYETRPTPFIVLDT